VGDPLRRPDHAAAGVFGGDVRHLQGKYRVLSESLFAAFRGAPRTMQPVQVGETTSGSGTDQRPAPINQSMIQGQTRTMLTPVTVKTGIPTADVAPAAGQSAAAKALQKVADEVERAMDDLVKANMVVVRRKDFWIEVEIRTDILFPSASAQLSPSAVGVIERLGASLAPFPNAIRVEGHTDNRPIKTVAFISNWELSAARAGSVVRVLASRGVAPERLAVIGYGENRPTHPNTSEDGRNANRRVVIVILSADPPKPDALPTPAAAGTNESNATPGPATLAAETASAAIAPVPAAVPVATDIAAPTGVPAPFPTASPAPAPTPVP
jgi:chemotaxis protein MotB